MNENESNSVGFIRKTNVYAINVAHNIIKLVKLIKIRQYMGKTNVKSVTHPLKQHNVIIRGIFYQTERNESIC